ncbi:hypothetical protein N798_10580, partial [Knoellia flava TL1]
TAATIVDRLVARAAEPAPSKTTEDATAGEPACPTRGWDETAGPLASRTRRLVTRHAPDVAATRRKQAVKDRCLTRRAISEAADQWHGLVPVEQSLVMWQAVDSLARTLQAADPALTLDQARVDAMQQLILQQADVTIHLHATHPAAPDAAGAATAPEPARATTTAGRAGATTTFDPATTRADARSATATAATAAPTPPDGATAASADSRSAAAPAPVGADTPTNPVHRPRTGLAERAVRGVVELGGLNRPGTTTVDLDRLPASVRLTDSTTLACHPDTGALLTGHVPKGLAPTSRRNQTGDPKQPKPPGEDGVERYRPSPALQRLVRLRDGHCRFPGCRVAARSCDLDHVIAWPTGPTTATNLICLCRRHHRVKQRLGWTVRLDPDGVAHWTDPGGRRTASAPVDHLDRVHHDDVRTAPMTAADLGALLSTPPASPHSLAELTLARLLELASVPVIPGERGHAPSHPAAVGAVECHFGPWKAVVEVGMIPPEPPRPNPPPPPF